MRHSNETDPDIPALLIDLYELTMSAAYWDNNINSVATFDLFFRNLPENRNYLITCGIERAINFILNLKFDHREINYLRGLPIFENLSPIFFEYLSQLRFTGTARAMPAGTFVFPNEPVVEITAPIIEAQILETALLSVINFETMVASKAARVVQAAEGRMVVEFGARRAHGPGAAVAGARAACIGGCVGTSNLEAGLLYNLPVYGTIAHSYIMAHDDELEAFEDFAKTFPNDTILLIDTYDTIEGAKLAVRIGKSVKAVRLDSGDLLELSREVRKILDDAGMAETKIMASSDLNETKLRMLMNENAPIDSFGIGSELITSKDAPSMPGVYKLVETREDGKTHYRIKLSKDKINLPGRKQVYRMRDANGMFVKDIIAAGGEFDNETNLSPLLITYINDGKLVEELPSIEWIQNQVKRGMTEFSDELIDPLASVDYPVEVSPRIKEMIKIAKSEHEGTTES